MAESILTYEKKGQIAYVTLNRPEVINCINGEMYDLLEEAVDDYADDDNLRCMIISGAGGNFSSGGDLKWWKKVREEAAAQGKKRFNYEFPGYKKMMNNLSKPVVAAIDGYCLASGFALALYCCDIRIASDRVKMATIAVQRSLSLSGNPNRYPMPLTWYTGLGNAMYIRLLSKYLGGEEALRMGLVNEVVPVDQLMARATEVAEIICKASPVAVARDKTFLRRFQEVPGSFFTSLENLIHSGDHFADYEEGSKAFLDKRDPNWK